jgi:hypothetical protein
MISLKLNTILGILAILFNFIRKGLSHKNKDFTFKGCQLGHLL